MEGEGEEDRDRKTLNKDHTLLSEIIPHQPPEK